MIIRCTVNDGSEKQRIFQEALDGFDEERRKVPCVSEGRSEGSGMFEVRVKGGCFRKGVQVLKGGWMSRDV